MYDLQQLETGRIQTAAFSTLAVPEEKESPAPAGFAAAVGRLLARIHAHTANNVEASAQFPPNDISALSPDQRLALGFSKNDDLARLKAQEHHVPLYASIREALTLGTDRLAVDGVSQISEGQY